MKTDAETPVVTGRPALEVAVCRLMEAADACDDLLRCCRVEDGATCLHRARYHPRERLCRTCRLVRALESVEKAVS